MASFITPKQNGKDMWSAAQSAHLRVRNDIIEVLPGQRSTLE